MTLKTMRNGMTLGVIAVLTITAAHAQSAIAVTVPFDYSAGGKVLPAGEYKAQTGLPNGLILLRNFQQGVSPIIFGNQVEPIKPAQDARRVGTPSATRHLLPQ